VRCSVSHLRAELFERISAGRERNTKNDHAHSTPIAAFRTAATRYDQEGTGVREIRRGELSVRNPIGCLEHIDARSVALGSLQIRLQPESQPIIRLGPKLTARSLDYWIMIMTAHQPSDDRLARLLPLLRLDPLNSALRRECASLAAASGDFETLESLARESLARDPEDIGAKFDQATVLLGRRDFAAARAAFVALRGGAIPAKVLDANVALCQYAEEDYAGVRATLEPLYVAGERTAGVVRLLASSCHHLGDLGRALLVADESGAFGEHDAGVAGVFALIYLDAERSADAAKWAKRCLALNPRSVDGLIVEATLHSARFDLPRARAAYQNAIEHSPRTARAWIGLGALSLLEQRFDVAKQELQRGLELMPNHVGSWHVLAWTHLFCGEIEEAQRLFERSLVLDRNFAETHGALAAIAAMQGRTADAERLVVTAERLDRDGLASRYARSVLAHGSGNPDAARQIVLDAVTSLAASAPAAFARGMRAAAGAKDVAKH
jgi:tetratricopeptide (TPR) repeat protein